ncbi:TRAP transporter small permease [Aminobacter sp. MSH1]|uniref:TRAP transporter small permease n=1 Tax=Aminobacter sp. MSH1 TaxID=374606 RepID=UPI000D35CBBA|nr:TRAP transporter small permease [Aminobacter sp. MSH1]
MNDSLVRGVVWKVSALMSVIGAGALFIMMMILVVDSFLRNVLNKPVLGSLEVVEITLVFVVFFGLPESLKKGEQIIVDVADELFNRSIVSVLVVAGNVAMFLLLALLAWFMFEPAYDSFRFKDVKPEVGLPLYWLWIAIYIGVLVSLAVVAIRIKDGLSSHAASGAHHVR